MRKMTKKLFVAAVAALSLTACSESTTEGVSEIPALPTGENTAVLTDGSGQKVSSLSAKSNTYYLDIKTNGAWYIEIPENNEFIPTKMYGTGSARVPVIVGNNVVGTRMLTYNVKFLDGNGQLTRAEGDGGQTVTQDALYSLDRFKKVVNSNVFVGYSFTPTKHAVPELCTGIQVFKMERYNNNDEFVKHDFVPQTKEEYYYHTCDSMMDKLVAVKGDFGGNFNVVKLGLSADVNVRKASTTGQIVVQKSLTRSMYSRELAWEKMFLKDSCYSEGYTHFKQIFIDDFKAAGGDVNKRKAAAEAFFKIVGTHVVTKCLLGCELNYRMTSDTKKTKNLVDVKAALDFKWQQQIKDTAKADSATKAKIMQLMKDSTKLKSVFFKGDVQYTNDQFDAATSTKAKVKARGNDVEKVNILATGGSLNTTTLAEWMLGHEPEKATMVGMQVLPIYYFFKASDPNTDEGRARAFLVDYIDKNYPLDQSKYGNQLEIDLSDLK